MTRARSTGPHGDDHDNHNNEGVDHACANTTVFGVHALNTKSLLIIDCGFHPSTRFRPPHTSSQSHSDFRCTFAIAFDSLHRQLRDKTFASTPLPLLALRPTFSRLFPQLISDPNSSKTLTLRPGNRSDLRNTCPRFLRALWLVFSVHTPVRPIGLEPPCDLFTCSASL